MAAGESIICTMLDQDFGELNLVETRTTASVDGGPSRPLIFRSWQGKHPELDVSVLISNEDNPLVVGDDVRASFRKVVADVAGFKKLIAGRELALAKSWAQDGGLDLPLTEDSFAGLLRIDGFSIDPGRLTVWLEEDAEIFAGHALEVRIENGEIIEVCLSG